MIPLLQRRRFLLCHPLVFQCHLTVGRMVIFGKLTGSWHHWTSMGEARSAPNIAYLPWVKIRMSRDYGQSVCWLVRWSVSPSFYLYRSWFKTCFSLFVNLQAGMESASWYPSHSCRYQWQWKESEMKEVILFRMLILVGRFQWLTLENGWYHFSYGNWRREDGGDEAEEVKKHNVLFHFGILWILELRLTEANERMELRWRKWNLSGSRFSSERLNVWNVAPNIFMRSFVTFSVALTWS